MMAAKKKIKWTRGERADKGAGRERQDGAAAGHCSQPPAPCAESGGAAPRPADKAPRVGGGESRRGGGKPAKPASQHPAQSPDKRGSEEKAGWQGSKAKAQAGPRRGADRGGGAPTKASQPPGTSSDPRRGQRHERGNGKTQPLRLHQPARAHEHGGAAKAEKISLNYG